MDKMGAISLQRLRTKDVLLHKGEVKMRVVCINDLVLTKSKSKSIKRGPPMHLSEPVPSDSMLNRVSNKTGAGSQVFYFNHLISKTILLHTAPRFRRQNTGFFENMDAASSQFVQ